MLSQVSYHMSCLYYSAPCMSGWDIIAHRCSVRVCTACVVVICCVCTVFAIICAIWHNLLVTYGHNDTICCQTYACTPWRASVNCAHYVFALVWRFQRAIVDQFLIRSAFAMQTCHDHARMSLCDKLMSFVCCSCAYCVCCIAATYGASSVWFIKAVRCITATNSAVLAVKQTCVIVKTVIK